MDGIFGVGLAEMIIIALALFVIGGPENTAKWARQAGRIMRQVREAWNEFTKDLEKELGPEGKELMDVTREFSQGAAELRRTTSPRRLLSESAKAMEAMAIHDETFASRAEQPAASNDAAPSAETPAAPEPSEAPAAEEPNKYRAWQPPLNGQ